MATRTFMAKEHEVEREWWLIDATDRPIGRLATEVAKILRGKHKPIFTPHCDTGDHVIIINAAKVKLTGMKAEKKVYHRYTGYPGGLRSEEFLKLFERRPERVVESAIVGMLPHTKLGRAMASKLKVYRDDKHPHAAQKPQMLALAK